MIPESGWSIWQAKQADTPLTFWTQADFNITARIRKCSAVIAGFANPTLRELRKGAKEDRITQAHFTMHFHKQSNGGQQRSNN
jgi:hypothetical protein